MLDFEIAPLDRDDIPYVAQIERENFASPFKEQDFSAYLNDTLWHFFVARSQGEVLGHISLQIILDECQIANIVVKEGCRHLGIGRALLEGAIDFARKKGVRVAFLEVRESNLGAISLYEKLGFTRAGVSKNHYSQPRENAILMNLNID